MKKIIKAAARMTPVFLALAMFCSSPTDKDLRWRTSVDFPITANKKFFLGAMMDTLFFNHQQVQRTLVRIDTTKRTGLPNVYDTTYDTTMMILKAYPLYDSVAKHPIPDTVAFGFPTRDTATDTISEDSLADKYFTDAFGPIPLSGTPTDTVSVPLAGSYASGTPVSLPAVPLKLKWVYHVELTNTAQFINVNVTNNSAANFSRVIITLGSLGADTINNLPANSTATAQYNARAQVIDSIVNVTVAYTPSTTGTFTAGVDNLSASLSFDSLYASKVVVVDYLLAGYQRMFTNEYNLTDTVNVDYIDIAEGVFIYRVTNKSSANLILNVTHRNLWFSSFCVQRNITSVSGLVGLSYQDSLPGNYNGRTAITSFAKADTILEYSNNNLSANRLFPEWNPVTKQSVTKVDYLVKFPAPSGNPITFSAGDSLSFVIKANFFKFKQMVGHTMEQYRRTSDVSSIPVKLPWSQAVTDSLRGHFILNKVLAEVGTRMDIPAGAFLDTVRVNYEISSATNPAVKSSDSAVLLHVMRDSLYHRPIDITSVVNNYPDSVKVKVALTVPVNTFIKAVNDLTDPTDPAYPKYIGRMVIHGQVNYNLVAPLCWTVKDTTVMDLGGTTVDLGGANGAMGPFARMSDRSASLNIHVTNYTNVYLRLYALLATDSAKVDLLAPSDTADTAGGRYITTNQFTQLINHPTAGYVNLLGNGLLIPPRDSIHSEANVIALTEQDLTQILNAKKIGMRWEVRFIPQPTGGIVPDALSNTDWMKLNSWIHIDGVNSLDSLFKK